MERLPRKVVEASLRPDRKIRFPTRPRIGFFDTNTRRPPPWDIVLFDPACGLPEILGDPERDHSHNIASRWIPAVGILCIGSGTWQLEPERSGRSIVQIQVGQTPATVYQRVGSAKARSVINARGFGSRQPHPSHAMHNPTFNRGQTALPAA
jgi:hypothetical protein